MFTEIMLIDVLARIMVVWVAWIAAWVVCWLCDGTPANGGMRGRRRVIVPVSQQTERRDNSPKGHTYMRTMWSSACEPRRNGAPLRCQPAPVAAILSATHNVRPRRFASKGQPAFAAYINATL